MYISYDGNADVLYVMFKTSKGKSVSYHQNEEEIIIRTDKETGEALGYTIPNLSRRKGFKI